MNTILPILIVTVGVATVLNLVLKRFNIPTVIGYIFTGAIVAAIFHINVHSNETLEHIAEFGVVFLMFTIGLEFSAAHLNSMKKEVFLIGALQVTVTAAVITMLTQVFTDLSLKTGVIVGAGLALSSTAIVLKILNETGKIKSEVGRNSLGILVFQDIAVIPILLMITIFTDQSKTLSELLIDTAINAVIALAILIVIGKFVLGHVFKAVSGANSKEIYMGTVLFVVVGASYIAHHFGFSYSLGGFIAGMMIADTIYKYQIEADLIPFRDLLLGVFFVSVGLQIDASLVVNNIVPVIGLVVGIMLVKAVCIYAILVFSNSEKVSLKTAITLAQIGEFSLVVFSLVLNNQMMDTTAVQLLMVVIIISMVMTPFLINNVDRIVGLIIKDNIEEKAVDQTSLIGGHVILCGYGSFGRVVSEKLDAAGVNHVIVTDNTEAYVKARKADKSVVFGDPADKALLERLQVRDAMSTVLALRGMHEVKQATAAISLIDPDIKVIAKVPAGADSRELEEFNHELVLDENTHTAELLVEQISRSRVVAKESAKLQYLNEYSLDNPGELVTKIEKEQARLLSIMSHAFNALREDKDIMQIKAYYESFKVLNEITGGSISQILLEANLSPADYARINTLMDNQHQFVAMNQVLEELGKELKQLGQIEATSRLSQMAVEGLDTILLSLKDLVNQFDQEDMLMLRQMTSSEGGGLSRIRESYLNAKDLDSSEKALLLSATNHMDRLRDLFGAVGKNYEKLASA